MKPIISVIVNTKNEEKNIRDCLASVKNQDYSGDKIEIIVVDNDSSDRTKNIAEEFTPLVYNQGPERSAQRNWGGKMSHGEYILFLDADMRLSSGVVSECVRKVQEKNLAALYIPEIIRGKGFFSRLRNLERSFYDATDIDAVRFIKKDIFSQSGGFDEKMYSCEDWDLTKRIKKLGGTDIIKSPLYHDETEIDLKKHLHKKSYYSRNMRVYLTKWGEKDPAIKKQFGIYYRFWGVFTEKGKWKKLAAHPILAMGIFFLKFLVGVKYLLNRNKI